MRAAGYAEGRQASHRRLSTSHCLFTGAAPMLSQETLESYRKMTPGERLELALRMTDENIPALFAGSPALVDRRFELLKRENDQRNHNLLTAIARTRKKP